MSAIVPDAKILLYILVFTTTFAFPGITLLFLHWQKVISNIQLEDKKERMMPLIATLMFYYLGYYILGTNNVSGLLRAFFLGAIISLTLTFFVNIFWKISAHLIGIGGIVGLILAMSFRLHANLLPFLMIIILLAGLLGTARVVLKSHNPLQVIAGFYLGLIVVYSTVMLY